MGLLPEMGLYFIRPQFPRAFVEPHTQGVTDTVSIYDFTNLTFKDKVLLTIRILSQATSHTHPPHVRFFRT